MGICKKILYFGIWEYIFHDNLLAIFVTNLINFLLHILHFITLKNTFYNMQHQLKLLLSLYLWFHQDFFISEIIFFLKQLVFNTITNSKNTITSLLVATLPIQSVFNFLMQCRKQYPCWQILDLFDQNTIIHTYKHSGSEILLCQDILFFCRLQKTKVVKCSQQLGTNSSFRNSLN